jgi:hypothetical protein
MADQTEPWPAGQLTGDLPLPQRWYKYRGRVLRTQKQMAHSGDVLYEQIKEGAKRLEVFNG